MCGSTGVAPPEFHSGYFRGYTHVSRFSEVPLPPGFFGAHERNARPTHIAPRVFVRRRILADYATRTTKELRPFQPD